MGLDPTGFGSDGIVFEDDCAFWSLMCGLAFIRV